MIKFISAVLAAVALSISAVSAQLTISGHNVTFPSNAYNKSSVQTLGINFQNFSMILPLDPNSTASPWSLNTITLNDIA